MQLLGESEARIFDLMLKAVGAAIAAAWVFCIYSAERAKDRDIHRQIEQQSYVIPFMRSSEDLRSRLYNVIISNGLSSLVGFVWRPNAEIPDFAL